MLLAQQSLLVPPGNWHAQEIKVSERNSVVECVFSVKDEGPRVQVLLLNQDDARRFHRGRAIEPIMASGYVTRGQMRALVKDPGEYVLLFDNRLDRRKAASVHLQVNIAPTEAATVRTLPADKRRVVVALSLLFFGAVLAGSAIQLRKQMRG